jgi:hypothetical protein
MIGDKNDDLRPGINWGYSYAWPHQRGLMAAKPLPPFPQPDRPGGQYTSKPGPRPGAKRKPPLHTKQPAEVAE